MKGKAYNFKTYFIGYMLWFFLGWLGAHRFYVKRWPTALIYAALSLSLISICIYEIDHSSELLQLIALILMPSIAVALLIDSVLLFFFIRGMIMAENKTNEINTPEDTLQLRGIFQYFFDYPLTIIFFITAPMLFIMYLINVNMIEFGLIVIAVIIFIGYIESLETITSINKKVEWIPAIGDIIGAINRLHQHYRRYKPSSILYYIVFPVIAPVYLIIKKEKRTELKLFATMIIFFIIMIIIDFILEYTTSYYPYISPDEAVMLLGPRLFVILLITLFFIMPMSVTSIKLNIAGKYTIGKILSAIAIISTIAGILLNFKVIIFDGDSTRYYNNLIREKPAYQSSLIHITDNFIKDFRKDIINSIRKDAYEADYTYTQNKYVKKMEKWTETYRKRYNNELSVIDESDFSVGFSKVGRSGYAILFMESNISNGTWGTIPDLYAIHYRNKTYYRYNELPQNLKGSRLFRGGPNEDDMYTTFRKALFNDEYYQGEKISIEKIFGLYLEDLEDVLDNLKNFRIF